MPLHRPGAFLRKFAFTRVLPTLCLAFLSAAFPGPGQRSLAKPL